MDNGLDMNKATYCPLCRLREATKADTLTVPQGEDGGLCWARWGSGCPPRPRPTSRPMRGVDTGEAAIGKTLAFVDMLNPATWCTADEAL
jgi:hypothetical protein